MAGVVVAAPAAAELMLQALQGPSSREAAEEAAVAAELRYCKCTACRLKPLLVAA